MANRPSRRRFLLITAALVLQTALAGSVACGPLPPLRHQQVERVQLHRNGNRGLDYLPLQRADGSSEPATFSMRPLHVLAVPGNGTENVRANVHPIDADGDGAFEFLQVNGSRFMRLLRRDGGVLWETRNPAGRLHRSEVHRDALAVLDVDGDRRQEVLHCWVLPGTGQKRLVLRRGDSGAILRSTVLTGDSAGSECQIAAYRPAAGPPVALVAREIALPGVACARRYADLWAVTAAFDPATLQLRWQRSTCDAGHYPRAVDENRDGAAEAVFVGKYLLGLDGALRCTLPGWGQDHVDGMAVANFLPAHAGHEVVAIGLSGTRVYRVTSCALLPLQPIADFANPQHLSAVRFASDPDGPTIAVRQRNTDTEKLKPVVRIDATGTVADRFLDDNRDPQSTGRMPMMNANLDGAAASEDLVAWFGQVLDRDGRLRLDTGWYWDLQRLEPGEEDLSAYDQWTNAPVVFDLDADGRDEMITWGRRLIVVGTRETATP